MRFTKPIYESFPVDFAPKINNEVHVTDKNPVLQKSKFNFALFSFGYEIITDKTHHSIAFKLDVFDKNDHLITNEMRKRLRFLFEHEDSTDKVGFFICIERKNINCFASDIEEETLKEFADLIERVRSILNYHFEKNFYHCLIPNEKDREIERINEIEKRYYQFLKDPNFKKGKHRKKNQKFINSTYLFLKRLCVFK